MFASPAARGAREQALLQALLARPAPTREGPQMGPRWISDAAAQDTSVNPTDAPPPFAQVLADYARLEPGESDTWNPLHCEVELHHRMELLRQMAGALRAARVEPAGMRVLDLGCGNGRSTRMYLDLGFTPGQLVGLDLRPGAIARARELHPGIEYRTYDGARAPFDDGAFDWVSCCTVFSSIRGQEDRRHLADDLTRLLRPGGHLFFWDLRTANDFAGADALRPQPLFPALREIHRCPARIAGFEERELEAGSEAHARVTDEATHDGVVLRR